MKSPRTLAIALAGGAVAIGSMTGTAAYAASPSAAPAPAEAAAAAAAAKPKLRTVTVSSKADTRPDKTLTAWCPRGYRAIGGSTSTKGPRNDSGALGNAHPFHGRRGDGYVASWRSGPHKPWSIQVSATCAKGLSGVRIVSRTAKVWHDRPVTVNCPAGTRVLGFGAKVGGNYHSYVGGFGPAKNGRGAYAKMHFYTSGAYPEYWTTVYAACAKAPARYRLTIWNSPKSPKPTKTGYVRCPAGTRPYGTGAAYNAKWQSRTSFTSVTTTKHGSYASVLMTDPTPNEPAWQLRIHGICAR